MEKDIKNILLVYPEYLKTFWSFEYVMKILGRKAAYPPLGLLTISLIILLKVPIFKDFCAGIVI